MGNCSIFDIWPTFAFVGWQMLTISCGPTRVPQYWWCIRYTFVFRLEWNEVDDIWMSRWKTDWSHLGLFSVRLASVHDPVANSHRTIIDVWRNLSSVGLVVCERLSFACVPLLEPMRWPNSIHPMHNECYSFSLSVFINPPPSTTTKCCCWRNKIAISAYVLHRLTLSHSWWSTMKLHCLQPVTTLALDVIQLSHVTYTYKRPSEKIADHLTFALDAKYTSYFTNTQNNLWFFSFILFYFSDRAKPTTDGAQLTCVCVCVQDCPHDAISPPSGIPSLVNSVLFF